MPRPRQPFLHREVSRHGKTVWYFRKGRGPRIRLPGAFGSAAFNAAYQAAMEGREVATPSSAAASPARQRTSTKSFVYFAAAGNLIKIGVSRSPAQRLESLKTGNAHTIEIIKTVPGNATVERAFHKRFAPYRVRGEWFRRHGELAAYLDGLDAVPEIAL